MAITELSDNEPLVTHVPALGHDLMVEGDVTGHPVHPLLRPLFPGGLRSEIYSLDGASDVGLGLLVNGWCGVVGMPELQGAQMRRWGVDASRLVMVSSPRGWLATVAALVEELDVVMPVRRPSCRCRPLAGSPPGSGPVGPPWSSAGDGPVRSHTLMCAPSDGGNRNR